MLWAWLEDIGVGLKMLAAIKPQYASGTSSMEDGGQSWAFPGPAELQDCPVSPTLFIFLDGLHGHLDRSLPQTSLKLGCGRWVSAHVYADDVVLLSWTAAGLQSLLYSMHTLCFCLGLTISPSKIEVVLNGNSSDTWHCAQHVLP